MGRRIRYRPTRGLEEFPVIEERSNTFWRPRVLIPLGLIWGGLFVLLVVVAVLRLQDRNYQSEFAPLTGVCHGKWVKEVASTYSGRAGAHPAVVVRESAGGGTFERHFLPASISAQSLPEAQVVVCLGPVYEVFIESCPGAFPFGGEM